MELISLLVTAITTEAFDTKSFVLKPVGNHDVTYEPGQFLTLVFSATVDARRSYSISSASFLGEPLTITVKRIDNGAFSRFLFDTCKVGDTLQSIGVSGFFLLPKPVESHQQFFFLAAGSGITPVLPMIKTLLHQTSNTIYLLYSNKSEETIVFKSALQSLKRDFPSRFHVTWLNSNSKNLLQARLTKIFLTDFVKQHVNIEKSSALFYLCGPKDYMQMATITLLTTGIPSANIRKEIFDTTKVNVRELPPDTDAHYVTLIQNGKRYKFTAQYPETILVAAKREGLILPYSCEAGKCGTCAATCSSGRVWMSYNEVLVERELQKGRVLTCTGYAVAGDVTIDYDA
ncbi:ferredoxin--NADP reductase [Pseudochryseolinea flava]|uniref:Ring-1,2-phenylacetyl-CoA epoxidase subunit PaaE n=1 Tax=Pseudochryseolinea flava TaxID=2059302 RepID=A0A364XWA3_9BACT|nr:ferredoxin--NADP reductase [Pseudochryseolinea flava]RAV98471.1 hypothetical protein DQQ10_23385 [Pseudochryseolinea flava]